MTYRKRAFTALAAGALALPLLATPASAGHGGPQAGPPQNVAEFCTNPFQEAFVDVAAGDTFARDIQCIATAGRETGEPITRGGPENRPANQYGPNLNNLRGQMASFIARMLDAAEQRDREQSGGAGQIQALPAYDGQNEFTDVPANFTHVAAINRLADANIALGGPNGAASNTYGPNQSITRAQMATFINRAAAFAMSQNPLNAGSGAGYTATSDFFVDEDQIAIHREEINGLASVGIVVGVQPESEHRYAPRANVTRAQMAGFLARTLSQLFDDNRVHSLLETLTGNADADSRQDEDVAADETRSIQFENLNPNFEYRVTLVKCENVTREANDLVRFARNADGTANTGSPSSRIVGTGTGNSGNAITPTGSTTTTGSSTFSVEIENDTGNEECVVAVIYRNGSAGKTLAEGGTLPQLEVDATGRPVEFFGISGDTTFAEAGEPPVDALSIDEARVATDAAMTTEGGTATDTASSGDVFELTFDQVATESATATPTVTFEDDDGDSFTAECVETVGDAVAASNTAATCTLSEDGRTLSIELLGDPVVNGDGDGILEFPLTITDTTGIVDENGDDVDLEDSDDVEVERDDDTEDVDDPDPPVS